MEASIRHSQFDVPIALTAWEDLDNRSSSSDIPPSRTSALISPLGTTFDYPEAQSLYRPPLPPPPPFSNIIQSPRSQSEISQLTNSIPGTPTLARSWSFQRSPSPISDKQATPPEPSYLSQSTPKSAPEQPAFSEKQVLQPSGYPTNFARAPPEDSFTRQLARSPASPTRMEWLRRRSQREPPARHASVSSSEEKRTLDQSTGVTSLDEKQPVFQYESSLFSQISQARIARVSSVVDVYLEPLIREQASQGLMHSTFVIVPETASTFNSGDFGADNEAKELYADTALLVPRILSKDMLVGFPSELNVQVVRLHPSHSGHTGHTGKARDVFGDEGTRFWQQPTACQELDRLLKIRLVGMSLDVIDPTGLTTPFRKSGWTERGEQVGGTPNMKISFSSSKKVWKGDQWQAGVGIWENGGTQRSQSSWQLAEAERLMPGQASVKVNLQDVCFRTESAMGLYDTKTDKAVVVRIAIEG